MLQCGAKLRTHDIGMCNDLLYQTIFGDEEVQAVLEVVPEYCDQYKFALSWKRLSFHGTHHHDQASRSDSPTSAPSCRPL